MKNFSDIPRGRAVLAPMAGVTDAAFREICRECGAAATYGEMASAKGMCFGDRKAVTLVTGGEAERPFGAQLFGNEEKYLAEAVRTVMRQTPDFIDLNCGCPAPKIAGNGCGSALMKNPELIGRLVRAMVNESAVPVTVKLRAGWDENSITAVEAAQAAEAAGAAAITVHGRTRVQMYAPPVSREIIRRVKEAVTVPVIANGDIFTPRDARDMLDETGCDFVMIGRGALGRPYIFGQINAFLENQTILPVPDTEQRMELMLKHISRLCGIDGERGAMLEARKHAAWYMKGLRGAAALRRQTFTLETLDDLKRLAEQVIRDCSGEDGLGGDNPDDGGESPVRIGNFA